VFGNWPALLLTVVPLSAALTYLSAPPTRARCLKRFIVIVGLMLALMGFGAVSGKTLGDFLRNANG
jgi:hypothetical protein